MDIVPWNLERWIKATTGMSKHAEGIFLNILVWYYKNESPPKDDVAFLAGCARCSLEEYLKVADEVRSHFQPRDGVLYNELADEVLGRQYDEKAMAVETGRQGAMKRWEKVRAKEAKSKARSKVDKVGADRPPNRPPIGPLSQITESNEINDLQTSLYNARGNLLEESTSSLTSHNNQTPSSETHISRSHKRADQGTRLDPDWRPNAENCKRTTDLGFDLEAEIISFRNYWVPLVGPASKTHKLDWNATFHNRITDLNSRRRPNAQTTQRPLRGAAAVLAKLGQGTLFGNGKD